MKQETLEEVAEKYANTHQDVSEELGTYLVKAVFQDGAQWQQEQDKNKFSEEDMLNFAQKYAVNTLDKSHIEQFKKK